jgi:hypothetical protein
MFVIAVSARITKLPAVPRVSAVGLAYTGGHIDVAVAVAVAVIVGLGVGVPVDVFVLAPVEVFVAVAEGVAVAASVDVPVGVFVAVAEDVAVTAGVAVDVSAAVGPVTPLFQVPQPAAMKMTGLTATSNVKRNFLFTISNLFIVLKNMVSLFFCELLAGHAFYSGRPYSNHNRQGFSGINERQVLCPFRIPSFMGPRGIASIKMKRKGDHSDRACFDKNSGPFSLPPQNPLKLILWDEKGEL